MTAGRFGIHTGVVDHGGGNAVAALNPEGGERQLMSQLATTTWAARFFWAGFRTASFSSFREPVRPRTDSRVVHGRGAGSALGVGRRLVDPLVAVMAEGGP